ncbi:MAG: NifB/NifX family molybdenum-iron cluster-binding protein [Spirochaetia bacterium]|jgi:predicted Fe-Mo cluster-binding NifX family protein|nr:NifB/NifX family molybdenum-iron cluster-binding protein [Spirochaetia bacterium]
MKVAMAVTGKDLDSKINPTFGRTPFFLIYDTETKKETYIDNPAMNASGGAGIQAAQVVIDTGADTVIAYRFGENAAKVFEHANVKSYKATEGTVKENIEKLESNELSPLQEVHPGFHHA